MLIILFSFKSLGRLGVLGVETLGSLGVLGVENLRFQSTNAQSYVPFGICPLKLCPPISKT